MVVEGREIEIRTGSAETVIDLTGEIETSCGTPGPGTVLHVRVPHATAGLAVLETGAGSDDDLLDAGPARPGSPSSTLPSPSRRDLLPADDRWQHRHGSAGHGRDHVLPALVAPSRSVPVLAGRAATGTWQSVRLIDTNRDNPVRTVRLSFLAG